MTRKFLAFAAAMVAATAIHCAYGDDQQLFSPPDNASVAPEPKIDTPAVTITPLSEKEFEKFAEEQAKLRATTAPVEHPVSKAELLPDGRYSAEVQLPDGEVIKVKIAKAAPAKAPTAKPKAVELKAGECLIDGKKVVIAEYIAKWYDRNHLATVKNVTIESHLKYHGVSGIDLNTLDSATKHMLHSAMHEEERRSGKRHGERQVVKTHTVVVTPAPAPAPAPEAPPPPADPGEEAAPAPAPSPSPVVGNCPNGNCAKPNVVYQKQKKRSRRG